MVYYGGGGPNAYICARHRAAVRELIRINKRSLAAGQFVRACYADLLLLINWASRALSYAVLICSLNFIGQLFAPQL